MTNLIALSGKKQHGKDEVCKIIKYLTLKDNSKFSFDAYKRYLKDGSVDIDHNYEDYYSYWNRKLFADKLKDIVCLLLGCTREQLEDDVFKNTPLGEEWRRWYYTHTWGNLPDGRISIYYSTEQEAKNAHTSIIARFPKGIELESHVLTPRLILQVIGTEGLRDLIHPNVHVNALFSDYKPVMTGKMYIVDMTGDDTADFSEENVKAVFESYPYWIITDCRFPNEAKAIKERKGIIIRVEDPRKISTDNHPSETSLDDYNEFDWKLINDGSIEDLIVKVKDMLYHFEILKDAN